MADKPLSNNHETSDFSEDEIEKSHTIAESDMVVDQEDYQTEETENTDEWEEDIAQGPLYVTQHSDGHTYDPSEAQEQGLTYTPPTDPPTLPGDDPQGTEIAAGFAPSIEESDPDVRDLPPTVDDNDFDIQEDVYEALRNNSETSNLASHIVVSVVDRVVYLGGTVPSTADASVIEDIVRGLEGVADVQNKLNTRA